MPTYNETPGDKEVVDVYYEARWKERDRGRNEKKFDNSDHTDPEVQLAAALAFATTKSLELSQGFNATDTDTRVEIVEIEVHERRMRIFTKDEVMKMLKPKVEGFSEPDIMPVPAPKEDPVEDEWVAKVYEPDDIKPVNLDDEIPF